ncbi:MAG: type II toxin-antitoxin system HicB family antitoxin [Alphaproteobacteria bacterium]|nr:type II toxin-antitoxin system HicB family antitoxin [Alphaproteobacteria bacterium]
MKFKGYTAGIEFDDEAELFHGEIAGINAVITFQANNAADLKMAFRESVDDYLDWCTARQKDPEKPFSGNFPVRGTPELHRMVFEAATARGKGLNAWVTEQLSVCAKNSLQDTLVIK